MILTQRSEIGLIRLFQNGLLLYCPQFGLRMDSWIPFFSTSMSTCVFVSVFQVVGGLLQMSQMQDDYDSLVTSLLDWIYFKIRELKDRNFPNNLEGIQREVILFKKYRTEEKPPK